MINKTFWIHHFWRKEKGRGSDSAVCIQLYMHFNIFGCDHSIFDERCYIFNFCSVCRHSCQLSVSICPEGLEIYICIRFANCKIWIQLHVYDIILYEDIQIDVLCAYETLPKRKVSLTLFMAIPSIRASVQRICNSPPLPPFNLDPEHART